MTDTVNVYASGLSPLAATRVTAENSRHHQISILANGLFDSDENLSNRTILVFCAGNNYNLYKKQTVI